MFCKGVLGALLVWSLLGCGKGPGRPTVVKIALLSPQSQSSSQAGQVLQSTLTMAFIGLSDAMVFSLPNRRQVADVAPNFILEPMEDRSGFSIQIFDGPSQRHVTEVFCAVADCARQIGEAIGVTPRKLAVVAAAVPTRPTAEAFAALAALSPDDGTIYEQWVNYLLSQNRREEIGPVITQALQRTWPPLERAQFEVLRATMKGEVSARVTAIGAVARAWPANVPLQLQAADGLNQRRDFKGALPLLQAALRGEPDSFQVLSNLAYTQAFAGDFSAALQTAQLSTAKANQPVRSLDLEGDIRFVQGNFGAAETAYLAAAEKDAAFELGRLYAKAAEAALWQNQVERADGHMQRFFGVYQKGVPAGIAIVQGLWLWRIGQRVEARRQAEMLPSIKPLFDFLADPTRGGPPPAGTALQALAQGRAPEAAIALAEFIRQQPLPIGLRWDPVLAVALAEAGRPTEACALLSHWGLPPSPDDWSPAAVWPRQLSVRANCLQKSDPARADQLRQLVVKLTPK